MDWVMILIRALHVLLAVFWAGAVFFSTLVLMPAVVSMGPGAGPFMAALQRRNMPRIMSVVAMLTLLTGLGLYFHVTDGMPAMGLGTQYGLILALGALAGISAFLLGVLVGKPTQEKMQSLTAEMARDPASAAVHSPTLERLRGRMAALSKLVAGLLLVAVLCMALARHV